MDLGNKAMLAVLSISAWSARRFDKRVTKNVNDTYASSQDAGRWNKLLLAKESIKEMNSATTAARVAFKKYTLPWCDDGVRILSNKGYDAFCKEMRSLRESWEDAVANFVSSYPAYVEDAKVRLNGMFNSEDYPSVHDIKNKFRWSVSIRPFPVGEDFRVELNDNELSQIREDLEKETKQAVADGLKDAWSRLHELVSHMAEKLGETDGIFRDSLVENIKSFCELLPILNVTEDPDLEAVRVKVVNALTAVSAQTLRDDKAAREATAKTASDIAEDLKGFMS